jgi:hypothetical protein
MGVMGWKEVELMMMEMGAMTYDQSCHFLFGDGGKGADYGVDPGRSKSGWCFRYFPCTETVLGPFYLPNVSSLNAAPRLPKKQGPFSRVV